jgi:stage V sporulation protein S
MTTETAVAKSVGTIKVGSNSDPNKVGGCIAAAVRHEGKAEVQTIGAGALNQAIKAIAVARGFLATSKIDLVCYPAFVDIDVDGSERTAIRLFVEPRGA